MFWNIYSKRVLSTLREKDTLVWTWIFPIMLATLFYFTFTSLDTANQLQVFPVAVVDDGGYRGDAAFQAALDAVSAPGDDRLFELTKVSDAAEADRLLESGEVTGYILVEGEPRMVVKEDGLDQTILKSFLNSYLQSRDTISGLLQDDPSAIGRVSELFRQDSFTKEISLTQNPATDKVNYFYALLAMICLYGGFQGLNSVVYLQPNLSPLGARRTMAPVGRLRMVTYDLLGGITVHFACVTVVMAYIRFVLGISFGNRTLPVLLTCLVGSLTGVAFGAMISVSSKLKEAAKVAIVIAVTMVCCFLAGLMTTGINYIIAEKAPVAAWLNPAARITDAFYCLYYYDTLDRYFLNIAVLDAMALCMFLITAFCVRRQRYESI